MLTAWITSRLTALGPLATALAATIAIVIVMGSIVGGLWWLRHDAARDARTDERAQCNLERETANREALEEQGRREREANEAAQRVRTAWLAELNEARERATALEVLLGARQSRVICYPRHIARELTR